MFRKISFSILAIAILIAGIIAFGKLGYWNRSVRIFSLSASSPLEERGGNRGEGRGESGVNRGRIEPGAFRASRDGERRGEGGFQGGGKINLQNIPAFLSVFALFTILAIYGDNAVAYFRRRKVKQV